MSDTPQGPGWWQASDDKWYPPPRPEMPGEAPPPGSYPSEPPTAPVGPGGPPLGSGPGIPGAAPSPYGGIPPGGPPGQNRTPLFVALGALGAAAVVLLVVLLASGGDDDPPEETGSTNTTEDDTATTDEIDLPDVTLPDDSGGGDSGDSGGQVAAGSITVADSGFAEYEDELYEETYTAYGVIIENTSDQVARNVSVQVGFLDGSGTVLTSETEYITVMMPGQKFGFGRSAIEATGVAELTVQVSEPSDWGDPADFGELTVEGLSVTFGDYNAPQAAFTVKSTYDEQLDGPNVYAIYRDSSGKIVGGDYDFMDFIQPGGSTVGEVSSYASLPNVDASKTEVFVDPNQY